MWKYYALLSALCASLTALFSKLGVRDINSDLATAIRVSFILVLVWGIALASGATREIREIAPRTLLFFVVLRRSHGAFLAVLLQGSATGRRVEGCSCGQAERAAHHTAFHYPSW